MKLARLCSFVILSSPALAQLDELVTFNGTLTYVTAALAFDVDQDGDADAVIFDQSGHRLRWFESLSGGAVSDARSIGTSTMAMGAPAVVDLDSDGDLDVLVSAGATPGWFENHGSGFNGFQGLTVAPSQIYETEVADMDGDNVLDLIYIAAGTTRRIMWSRGLGGGVFASPALVLDPPGNVFSLTPYDLDHDGDIDLVYVDEFTEEIACLRNDGAWPAATRERITSAPGRMQHSFDLGDLNGDGRTDVTFGVLDHPQAYEYVALNQGSLAFSGPVQLDHDVTPPFRQLIDIDNDHDLDIVSWGLASSPAYWRANTGGQFSARLPLVGDTSGLVHAAFADFDADGWPDFLKTNSGGSWIRNRATGTQPLLAVPIPFAPSVQGLGEFAMGDHDRDGDEDHLVFSANAILLRRNDGLGGVSDEIATADLPQAGAESWGYSADLNGDGALDLAIGYNLPGPQIAIWFGNGDGTFGPFTGVDWSPAFRLVGFKAVADVDSDGSQDLVMFGYYLGNPTVIPFWSRGDGQGGFAAPAPLWTPGDRLFSIKVADLDGDGIQDLIGRRVWNSEVSVRFGLGAGSFDSQKILPGATATSSFGLGDLDHDGDLDIHVSQFIPSDALLVYELTAGSYSLAASLPFPELIGGGIVIDADADGDRDIAVMSKEGGQAPGRLYLYEQASPLQFMAASLIQPLFPTPSGLRVVDYDQDGDEDLLWSSSAEGSTGLVLNGALGPIGSDYCSGAVPNSTGAVGVTLAGGSDEVAINAVTLSAHQLPAQTYGFFVGSQVQGSVMPVPNSMGRLCLGGSIVRFVQPGQVATSGPSGQFFVDVDLARIPGPGGPMPAAPGETWNFQAWHRDTVMGTATSNFTTALSITLR